MEKLRILDKSTLLHAQPKGLFIYRLLKTYGHNHFFIRPYYPNNVFL